VLKRKRRKSGGKFNLTGPPITVTGHTTGG